jgi:cytochrome c oxidase subunit 2
VVSLAIAAAVPGTHHARTARWIALGGVALTVVVLATLFTYSSGIGRALQSHGISPALRVDVTGRQWWWEVRYADSTSGRLIVLANEIHIPTGRPVELVLTTSDVIHSLWVPALAGKVDMIPGRTNRLVVRADRPGVFRGQCAEYCGGQHALMALYVVAQPEAEFRRWLANEAEPARAPGDAWLARGRDAFFADDCARCHTIRGTSATGRSGPDLTHVGGRVSLAAGTLGNHPGTMAGWISGAQDLKPGNGMPSTTTLTGPELRALSAWLLSLE